MELITLEMVLTKRKVRIGSRGLVLWWKLNVTGMEEENNDNIWVFWVELA
jgi:hypothetical protein